MGGESRRTLGDYFTLQRGTTYKSQLLGLPGPVLLGLATIGRNGGFRRDSLRTYGGESPAQLLVHPGELYVSLKDVTQSADLLGAVARLPFDHEPGRLTQDTVKLVPRTADVDLGYIHWLLRTPQYREYCRAHATGTTNLGLARDDFLAFEVPEYTAARQVIVQTLSTLDDKIELNRRMNETLEAMARALFKSWFVDAPGSGWKTAPLAEWVDALSGGTPSKSNAALWGGPLKWISPKAMTSIHADECDEHVTEQAIGNGTRIAPKGSTLVMVRGMGLHDGVRVSQAREDVTFNQDVKALVPKNIEADLLLFAMLDAQQELHKRVETSGHGTGKLPTEILLAHPITMPSREVQRERVVHISALNDQIASNRAQSRTLARVRDELLPRLLSGELSVADVERIAEKVTA